jgi:hypothetical protein
MIEEREVSNISGGVYGGPQSPYGLYDQPGSRRRTVEWIGAHGGSIALSVLGTAIGGLLLWQGARALNRGVEELEEMQVKRGLLGRAKRAIGARGIAKRLADRVEDVGEERRGGWLRRAKNVDVGEAAEKLRERVVERDDEDSKSAGTFGKVAKALIFLAIFDRIRRTGKLRLPRMSESRRDESLSTGSQDYVPEMR